MRLPETQREVLAPLRQQIRCLAGQIDVGLVRLSGALLALDAFFIAVFAAHTTYWAIYNEDAPTSGSEWHIGRDFSYAEIFGGRLLFRGFAPSALCGRG